jgi:hypothetical protein
MIHLLLGFRVGPELDDFPFAFGVAEDVKLALTVGLGSFFKLEGFLCDLGHTVRIDRMPGFLNTNKHKTGVFNRLLR